jgi:hypothetical protein
LLVAGALAVAMASGCRETSGLLSGPDGAAGRADPAAAEVAPDPPDPNNPAELLERHVRALESRNAFEYGGQLAVAGDHGPDDPGFRFFPVVTDFFPWMTDPWWGRGEELAMMGHLFDPDYAGANPPAETVEVDYILLNQRKTVDPAGVPVTELTVDMFLVVLVGPASGWAADTRLILDLGEDTGGRLRIRRIQEVPRFRAGDRVPGTWGQVKALYR